MKTILPVITKVILLCFIVIPGITAVAQISQEMKLEHTYSVSASICNLEEAGDMYFSMDVTNKQCLIHNLDHTLYRTVNLSVPADHYLYNIQHLSQHLFNTDDLIEFVYIYSKYNQTETSYYYSYETVVLNESGVEILKIPGAGHTDIIKTTDGMRKFLIYIYDFFQIPATTQTKVYSLPDQPAEPLKSGGIRNRYRIGNPWPNPSGGMVNIPVNLPPDVKAGELVLYNLYGQEVMREYVEGNEELILLPGAALIPGTYVYKLKHNKGESQGKRIAIY